jgi:hypothetical protein
MRRKRPPCRFVPASHNRSMAAHKRPMNGRNRDGQHKSSSAEPYSRSSNYEVPSSLTVRQRNWGIMVARPEGTNAAGNLRHQGPILATYSCMAPIFPERHTGDGGFSDMEPSMQYRKFAEDCRRLAQLAKIDEHRKILREMEIAWVRLAEEAERRAVKDPHRLVSPN